MLDLSDIFDEELCQKVVRITRREGINEFGEPIGSNRHAAIFAVVTSATSGDLNRYTDSTTYSKTIKVTTPHNLNPDNTGGQSDLILFEGDHYEVLGVDNYHKNGYTRAICSLVELQVEKNYAQ